MPLAGIVLVRGRQPRRPSHPIAMRVMQSFLPVGLFSAIPGVILVVTLACSKDDTGPATVPGLKVETLVSGLDTPWDIAWGPDGQIWVTERGGRISRVNPSTARRTTAGQVPDVSENG